MTPWIAVGTMKKDVSGGGGYIQRLVAMVMLMKNLGMVISRQMEKKANVIKTRGKNAARPGQLVNQKEAEKEKEKLTWGVPVKQTSLSTERAPAETNDLSKLLPTTLLHMRTFSRVGGALS